jgi:hypothetical protein
MKKEQLKVKMKVKSDLTENFAMNFYEQLVDHE